MQTLITPDAALRLILERVAPLSTETVSHEAALGRTLASDIASPLQLPAFDNSAVDGYALCAADFEGATAATPVQLQLLETIGAGEMPQREVSRGFCSKIMTGAPIPRGADAVVMREDTRGGDSSSAVEILTVVRPGESVRRAGSDVARGETVLRAGTVIGAAQWAMLAGLGIAQVEVARRPRVGIIATGAELVGVDAPLGEGQIRDSNSFALRASVQSCGAEIGAIRACGDTLAEFEAALREVAAGCDVVITSGGVSMGDFDPVRDVLLNLAEVVFWKVAMKPGKPLMFALFEGKPTFGLPGNPASVMVAFEEFARPALLKMGGRRALQRATVAVRLDSPLHSAPGRTEFVRAKIRLENGEWHAQFSADQGSGRLSTMTGANALLVIAADCERLEAGEIVPARLIDCPEMA